jgi:hypothetical protein
MGMRVYADTSVFGGVFDAEFEDPSRDFFDQVRIGRFDLVVSDALGVEIARAPAQVRTLFDEFLLLAQMAGVNAEVSALRNAYVAAGVVSPKWEADAQHVALATVHQCRCIISWNFKHIVHFDKIPLYNGVNLVHGYGTIGINTPAEVIAYP